MSKKHVVFVTGDHEYGGEDTMPPLAAELKKNYGLKTTVLKSHPNQNAEENIPGLEALDSADLAVFFLRWRRLPLDQVKHIEGCMKRGAAMMGFRTTSHSFKYPDDHPLKHWNAWAAEAFGAPPGWGNGHTHYGHESTTDVAIMSEGKGHPVMKGVAGPFHVRSWLYHVMPMSPPAGATPLLKGHAINPRIPAEDNPVAWVWKNKHGGRVFFTTLGHPEDFKEEPVVRLVVNAIHWCLDLPVPDPWKGMFKMDAPYRGMRK
ncbi:MAG: ThuA domain-containing protein [Planctomycetota bacterium]